MANSNSTANGGYLVPNIDPTDKQLRNFFQKMIVGITEIEGKLVRPRWQPNPPKQPENNIDWCAFGWQAVNSDANASVLTNENGEAGILRRDENIELLATFYGPNAMGYASMLRDGLEIEQNRYVLRQNGVAFQGEDGIVHLPEQINDIWYDRQDLTLNFTREVRREYNVLSFIGASGIIITDLYDPALFREFSAGTVPSDDSLFLLGDGFFIVNAEGDFFQLSQDTGGAEFSINANGDLMLVNETDVFQVEA